MAVDAADQEDAPDRLVGVLLANRYLIEHKLGEGAMGAVYRARHVKVGRPFAVKVLHRKLLEEKKIAQRFDREAELAGRLHHPNVIGVVDVGETPDGMRYMVMDFAEGSDLAELLPEAPMPPARIISLVRQMLEGLYHAHEAGLIHRDFKPENVIVERDDYGNEVPRIVDFGISILREGGDSTDGTGRLTTNGLVLGTPHYMAPEQAVADPIDHRIDLFAMGIVIYEMLCGKLPFDGNGAEVARANLLLDPPPISQRVPFLEADPLLEAFSRRLMAKKRDHRPTTARQARELLDLIDRDRAAAAAALGVPLETGTRAPQMTEPVARLAPMPTQETAPAKRISATADTAVQGAAVSPRPSGFDTRPAHAPASQLARTTTAARLPWGDQPSTRRRWIIAGASGLAAVGAILAVAIGASGSSDEPPPKPAEAPKVSMTVTPIPAATPKPAPEAAPKPAPETAPTPAPEIATSVEPPKPTVDPTKIRPTPTKVRKPDPTPVKQSRPETGSAGKPEVAKKDPTPQSVLDKIAPPADSSNVTQRWRYVEAQINALKQLPTTKALAESLYERWGRIKLNAAQIDEKERKIAMAELAELQRLITGTRSKP